MATAFTRTFRSLEDESRRRWAGALAMTAFLGAWAAWALVIHISLYETTTSARLEAARAASALQSPLPGRVVQSNLAVGLEVSQGDVLVQLDDSRLKLELEEKRTSIGALEHEIAGLRSQQASEEAARAEERRAALAAADEALAGAREAQAPALYNSGEESRLRQLREQGLISERDYQKGRAEAERSRAAADKGSVVVTRIEREQHARDRERDTRLRKIETDIVRLEGDVSRNAASIEVLRNEISRYAVRAPVSGRLGEAATLRPGSVVAAGDKLGAIVPSGRIQVVAQFSPAAMGRVQPGQRAAMRLEGFPWMQYGVLPATVSRVASEIRDGKVRVELAVAPPPDNRIPLGHGLPGTLEIEVERATPAQLILRSAGRILSKPRGAFTLAEAR